MRIYPDNLDTIPEQCSEISFYRTLPDYKQIVFGWDVHASLHCNRHKVMLFCFPQNLAGIELEYFVGFTRSLSTEVDLKYGTGYQRYFDHGPDLYAFGLISGLKYSAEDIAEGDRISAWMHEIVGDKRYMSGYLRDVYPLNVLSSTHLAREVEGISLMKWVEQDTRRGCLSQLGEDAWLWEVPQPLLADVRSVLQLAGCMIVAS